MGKRTEKPLKLDAEFVRNVELPEIRRGDLLGQ